MCARELSKQVGPSATREARRDLVRRILLESHPELKLSGDCVAALAAMPVLAMRDALRVAEEERLSEPQDASDEAYNRGINDATAAIRALLEGDGKIATQGNEKPANWWFCNMCGFHGSTETDNGVHLEPGTGEPCAYDAVLTTTEPDK